MKPVLHTNDGNTRAELHCLKDSEGNSTRLLRGNLHFGLSYSGPESKLTVRLKKGGCLCKLRTEAAESLRALVSLGALKVLVAGKLMNQFAMENLQKIVYLELLI